MFWNKTQVSQYHEKQLPGMEVMGALKGKISFVQAQIEAEILAKRPYDVLEEFIIRCLLEITPVPSNEDIANLLGFKDAYFITSITDQLERLGDLSRDNLGVRKVSESVTAASLCREIDGFKCRLTDGNRDHAGVA